MAKTNRGFIGLIALLISVAIIALIIVRTDLFGGSTSIDEDGNEVKNPDVNMIEGGFNAIDKARDAKNLIEENNRKAVEN
ncbi:MAG: hypothetical protein KBD52_00985 [Candidatus Pacebacteria bacterium]|nr:hypothetical protein [Candidatus Paceibacterota bacterium]